MMHVKQPADSSLCGQCCVAMIAGISLEEAIKVVGHQKKSGTWTKELKSALESLGIKCGPGLHRMGRVDKGFVLPPKALVVIDQPVISSDPEYRPNTKRPQKVKHWVLWAENRWWDPGNGVGWPEGYRKGSRAVSYMEVDIPSRV